MKSLTRAVLAIAVSAIACVSLAQGGGGGGRGFSGGQGRMGGGFGAADPNGYNLATRDDVSAEIKLTAEQKTKIQGIQQDQQEAMRDAFQNGGFGGGNTDREAMMKEIQKISEPFQKKIADVFTAEQKTRLKELAIQRAGLGAVNFPEVGKTVGLTDDQKAKIKELQTKQQEAMRSMMMNRDISREDRQAAMQKNTETMNTEMGKIVTDAQKAKLKELGGKEFKFKDPERRGGGGGL